MCLQARISCEATVVFFLWTFVFLFLSDVATGTLLDLADGANAAQTHSGTMRTESDPVTVHNHTAENNNTVWVRHTAGRLLNLRGASSMGSGETINCSKILMMNACFWICSLKDVCDFLLQELEDGLDEAFSRWAELLEEFHTAVGAHRRPPALSADTRQAQFTDVLQLTPT